MEGRKEGRMSLGHARAEREPGARRQLSEHVVSRRQNGDIKSNLLIGSEGREKRGPKMRQMGQKGSHHRHCYDRLNIGGWVDHRMQRSAWNAIRDGAHGPRGVELNLHATPGRSRRDSCVLTPRGGFSARGKCSCLPYGLGRGPFFARDVQKLCLF